ncbi:serine/threonine-protein kinase [Mycoplasmopsis agassizii]|uniref:Serine/threonine protein kinase n=1 Tax=Mycoplasmopsis agassizii TaxID=33922 RepID=A0ABX4H4W1_9BACT|nr:serine/threonine-protein kinase [Mycoplasmopsis agassizii]PAF54933.1 serine/threonine protein kinase [Mycoplasmopsis agassizii]SMC17094.1 serine/threonine protein kinase [Mycoplasmopsis agassizii]
MSTTMKQFSKYKTIKKIGEGGMATVYLVQDPTDNKYYAIKELKMENSEPARKNRFIQEMKIYSRVSSPYVARFIGGVQSGAPVPWMMMEYVDGVPLKDFITKQGGYLHYNLAAKMISDLARGFHEIHGNGIIHRDIKSTNIMVQNGTNNVKIVDFGIALTEEAERFTSEGKIIASVHYIAPELLSKQPPSVSSDIYALGILFYEMLIGKTPYTGSDMLKIAQAHRDQPLPDVRKIHAEIPDAIKNILARATAKKPEQRYTSMKDFITSVDSFINSQNPNGHHGSDDNKNKNFFGRLFKSKK